MRELYIGIFLVVSLIVLGYIGLTDVELSKIVNTCWAIMAFIIAIVDWFISRRNDE